MICIRRASLTLLLLAFVLPVRAAWISPFISEIHYDNVGSDVNELIAVTGPAELDLSGWRIVLFNGANGLPYRSVSLVGRLGNSDSRWSERSWLISGIQNGPDAVALVSPADRLIDFVAYESSVVGAVGTVAGGASARLLPLFESTGTPLASSLQRIGSADDWDWTLSRATPGVLNPGLAGVGVGELPVSHALQLWLSGFLAWVLVCGWRRRRRLAAILPPLRCRLE